MLPRCAICGTLPSVHSATVHILHRMCKSGKVRRLACPLRRFPFICPTELRGWQRNWIHRGAPRPANPVTCFPPGKVVASATKEGIAEMRQEEYGSTSPASTPCFPLRWQGNGIRREPTATENPVTRFPMGEVPRSGKRVYEAERRNGTGSI